jgi:hypothetical protein
MKSDGYANSPVIAPVATNGGATLVADGLDAGLGVVVAIESIELVGTGEAVTFGAAA